MFAIDHPQLTTLRRLALHAIDESGLQAPSEASLRDIISCSVFAASLLSWAALQEPTRSELEDAFCDFVIRAVNRAPGIGDATIN
jgi:hypothetical protein